MKKRVLIVILLSLFLVLFDVLFFLLGGYNGAFAAKWISFGAIHLSYLLMVCTPLITRAAKSDKIFGVPLGTVSFFYFALVFLVGVVFMIINPQGWKAAFIVQLIIFVLYAAAALLVLIAGASAEEDVKAKIAPGAFTGKAGELLADVQKHAEEGEIRDAVNAAAYALSLTPQAGREDILPVEAQIINRIKDLRVAVEKKDGEGVIAIAGDVRGMIEQRTAMLAQTPADRD